MVFALLILAGACSSHSSSQAASLSETLSPVACQGAQGESAKLEMGVLEARQQVGKQGALIRQQQAALRKQEAQLGEERQARQHQSEELRALHAHVEHLQNQARASYTCCIHRLHQHKPWSATGVS